MKFTFHLGSLANLVLGKEVRFSRVALVLISLLWTAGASLAQTIVYSPPITISKGGTYSGNWESRDSAVPAVTVSTQEPVIIENSNIRGAGHLIHTFVAETRLTIRNNKGYALTPTADGIPPGRFVNARRPKRLVIENNYMEGTSGNYLYRFGGSGTGDEVLKIVRNRALNVSGKHRNNTTRSIIHFVQFNDVQKANNVEIAWNEIINEPGKSVPEENINMYNSNGTQASPIRIHNNFIRGAYGVDPMAPSYPGGGILCDGKALDAIATAYIHAYENVIVGTTNHGMGIAAGNNNHFYNNRLVASGMFENGVAIPYTGSGIWMRNYHSTPSNTWFNNKIDNNVIGWARVNPDTKAAIRVDIGKSCDNCPNNTSLPGTITLDLEKKEYQDWLARCASRGIEVGPAGMQAPVANQAPKVAISSPAQGASLTAGLNLTLTVNASDADGRVTRVEYFQGSVKVGENTISPFAFTWVSVPTGSYSLKAIATDDKGAKTTSAPVSVTVTGTGLESTPPVKITPTHTLLREQWAGVSGQSVSDIPLATAPTSTSQLSLFEGPRSIGDSYGARISGYLLPPATGDYTFWISGDDHCELWLSTDENPANKVRIASLTGYSGFRFWTKYPSQQSVKIRLEAGKSYYVEALHKEAAGGDHVSVGWQLPNGTLERPIAGSHLSAASLSDVAPAPSPAKVPGTILREQWAGVSGQSVSDIPLATAPTSTSQLSLFEGPRSIGDSYGARISGYLLPPATGDYTFWISGDDHCELWLSTDENPANKVRIASLTGYSGFRFWTKYPSQQSVKIRLEAGKSYYVEALHKEAAGGDHVSVGWQLPNGTLERPIAGNRLAPMELTAASTSSASAAVSFEQEDLVQSQVLVFPNPAVNQVQVRTPSIVGAPVTISVSDGVGRVVYQASQVATGDEMEVGLDLQKLGVKQGLYYVRVESGKVNQVTKLVVNR